jgi:hypothetical protein
VEPKLGSVAQLFEPSLGPGEASFGRPAWRSAEFTAFLFSGDFYATFSKKVAKKEITPN